MFDSPILEIVIGLFFVYLLLSLLATAINELVMTYLNARGKGLVMGIQKLLDDSAAKQRLSHYIFDSPLFKKLYRPGSKRHPSYLSNDRFIDIFLFAIHERRIINELIARVQDQINRFDRDGDGNLISLIGGVHNELGEIGKSLDRLKKIGNEEITDERGDKKFLTMKSEKSIWKFWWDKLKIWRGAMWKTMWREYKNMSITAERAKEIGKIMEKYEELERKVPENPQGDEQKFWVSIQLILAELKESYSEFSDVKTNPLKYEDVYDAIENLADGDTKALLRSILREANGSITSFRYGLDKWYGEVMDKASAWYKRKVQIALLIIGIGVSIAFNADTFNVIQTLNDDPEARASLVAMAVEYTQSRDSVQVASGNQSTTHQQRIEALQQRVDELLEEEMKTVSGVLGLGWKDWDIQYRKYRYRDTLKGELARLGVSEQVRNALDGVVDHAEDSAGVGYEEFIAALEDVLTPAQLAEFETPILAVSLYEPQDFWNKNIRRLTHRTRYIFSHLIGWLFTAFAISLGAPFWFDLLKKIIHLRGTGRRPARGEVHNGSPVG